MGSTHLSRKGELSVPGQGFTPKGRPFDHPGPIVLLSPTRGSVNSDGLKFLKLKPSNYSASYPVLSAEPRNDDPLGSTNEKMRKRSDTRLHSNPSGIERPVELEDTLWKLKETKCQILPKKVPSNSKSITLQPHKSKESR